MSKRAKLSLSDSERRKGPPPAHGFEPPAAKDSPSPNRPDAAATPQTPGPSSAAGNRRARAAPESPRPAAGPWQADAGRPRPEPATNLPTDEGAKRPLLQRPLVRLILISAATAASLWLLKRRLF